MEIFSRPLSGDDGQGSSRCIVIVVCIQRVELGGPRDKLALVTLTTSLSARNIKTFLRLSH